VFHGDTIRVKSVVKDMRESKSRPNAGLVVFEHYGFNQRNEEVAYCVRTAFMKKRDA
jgi:acyl dehydratase